MRASAELGRVTHGLFVVPNRAEGLQRGVFEPVAAGCFVTTTLNWGFIMGDGVHGTLAPAGDAQALRCVIGEALSDATRLDAIGRGKAELIRESNLQRHYGEKVMQVYPEVCPWRPRSQ